MSGCKTRQRFCWPVGLALLLGGLIGSVAQGQDPAAAPTGEMVQITIDRHLLSLTPSERYRVVGVLKPVNQITVHAPRTGVINIVQGKIGTDLLKSTEVLRLNATREQLVLTQVQAEHEAAKLRVDVAKARQALPEEIKLAEAELDAAAAALKVAQHDVDLAIVRVPFDGRLYRLPVVPGQMVTVGEMLFEYGDPRQLSAEIPLDRSTLKEGDLIDVRVENVTVKAKVELFLPLSDEYQMLREVLVSPAMAKLSFPSDANLQPGQAVFSPVIPEQPVVRVPNAAVSNLPAGGIQRVQVLRTARGDFVVRDVAIRLHAAIGPDETYISGGFLPGDELILSSSMPLVDGTPLKPNQVMAPGTTMTPEVRQPGF